jgi:hypothetical protein
MTEKKLADIYVEMFNKSRRIEQDLKRLAELDEELKSMRARNDDPRIVSKKELGSISTVPMLLAGILDWIRKVESLAVEDLQTRPDSIPRVPKGSDVFTEHSIRVEKNGAERFEFIDDSEILRKDGEWSPPPKDTVKVWNPLKKQPPLRPV